MKAEQLKEQYGGIREARLALAKIQQELVAMEGRREFYCDPEAIAETFKDALGYMPEERWAAIFLDVNNKQIGPMVIYEGGTTTRAVLYPRNLFRDALGRDASGVVICHNHPGGSLITSEADRSTTRKLEDVGGHLGIRIVDHIIVTGTSWTSFRNIGLL